MYVSKIALAFFLCLGLAQNSYAGKINSPELNRWVASKDYETLAKKWEDPAYTAADRVEVVLLLLDRHKRNKDFLSYSRLYHASKAQGLPTFISIEQAWPKLVENQTELKKAFRGSSEALFSEIERLSVGKPRPGVYTAFVEFYKAFPRLTLDNLVDLYRIAPLEQWAELQSADILGLLNPGFSSSDGAALVKNSRFKTPQDLLAIHKTGMSLGDAHRVLSQFPELAVGDLQSLQNHKIPVLHVEQFHTTYPHSSFEELVHFWNNREQNLEYFYFKQKFPNTPSSEILAYSRAQLDFAELAHLKQAAPHITFAEVMELDQLALSFKKVIKLASACPEVSVSELIHARRDGIDPNTFIEFKRLDCNLSSATLHELHLNGVDPLLVKALREAAPSVTFENVLTLAKEKLDLKQLVRLAKASPDLHPIGWLWLKDLSPDHRERVVQLREQNPKMPPAEFHNLLMADTHRVYFQLKAALDASNWDKYMTLVDRHPEFDLNFHVEQNGVNSTLLTDAIEKNAGVIVSFLVHKGVEPTLKMRMDHPDLFKNERVPVSEKARKFARVYATNTEAMIMGAQKVDPKSAEAVATRKALIDGISGFGVPRDSNPPQIIREKHDVGPVETLFFYRSPEFYHETKRPILIYTHGGGAKNKLKTDRNDPILDYYIAQGYVVVIPNFREGTEEEDVYSVAKAVRTFSEVDVDPSRVFLTSISAGSSINLSMLEKIGKKEKPFVENPFAGVHLSTSIGAPNSKEKVQFFPKNIPYIIVHGEKDEEGAVQYMREVYDEMVKQGFDVDAYFSPTGNHHMVDVNQNISRSTPEGYHEFQDLAQWPAHFIPFFEKAKKATLLPDRWVSAIAKKLHSKSLEVIHPADPKAQVAHTPQHIYRSTQIPSLQYLRMFNSGSADSPANDSMDLWKELDTYYKNIQKVEENAFGFSRLTFQLDRDHDLRQQVQAALLAEQEFYQGTKVHSWDSKTNGWTTRTQPNDGVVAYHGTSGDVVGLYFLYSAIEALKSGSAFCPATFREGSSPLESVKPNENPLEILSQAVELGPDTFTEYSKLTLSMNPTLFSGDGPFSNSLYLWEFAQGGGTHEFGFRSKVHAALAPYLPESRIQEYQDLIFDDQNKTNGGLFQAFAPASVFDGLSQLTESLGVPISLNVNTVDQPESEEFKQMTVSDYQRLLRENPEGLMELFQHGKYSNPINWDIFKKPEHASKLFSIGQIRIPSTAKFTQKMTVNFYSHHPVQFNAFLKTLSEMLDQDSHRLACGGAPGVTPLVSSCTARVGNATNPELSGLGDILANISEYAGRNEVLGELHRLILQGDPKAVGRFMSKNRKVLGKNKDIRFRDGFLVPFVLDHFDSNRVLRDQMMRVLLPGA